MSELVHWTADPPVLRSPILLVALEGFVDAGEVGDHAAVFLRHRWAAEKVAELDRDAFLDFRARRPSAVVDAGVVNRLEWPRIELFAARLDGPHDAVLLVGPEPDMAWHALVEEVAAICDRLGIVRGVTLGAYPAATPHTRPVGIAQAGNAIDGPPLDGATPVGGYTGPVGAATVLQAELADRGVPVLGLWAEVPHYIAASPNPAGALAMVRTVAGLLGVEVDVAELEAAATLHQEQVNEAVADHGEAAQLIADLEEISDAGDRPTDIPSGEALADEIERFLRSED